jgi:hypothetical protein
MAELPRDESLVSSAFCFDLCGGIMGERILSYSCIYRIECYLSRRPMNSVICDQSVTPSITYFEKITSVFLIEASASESGLA